MLLLVIAGLSSAETRKTKQWMHVISLNTLQLPYPITSIISVVCSLMSVHLTCLVSAHKLATACMMKHSQTNAWMLEFNKFISWDREKNWVSCLVRLISILESTDKSIDLLFFMALQEVSFCCCICVFRALNFLYLKLTFVLLVACWHAMHLLMIRYG